MQAIQESKRTLSLSLQAPCWQESKALNIRTSLWISREIYLSKDGVWVFTKEIDHVKISLTTGSSKLKTPNDGAKPLLVSSG